MPRRKSVKTIDANISKLQDKIKATKLLYDKQCKELLRLQEEREALLGAEIIRAFRGSRKTYREVMTFLGQ